MSNEPTSAASCWNANGTTTICTMLVLVAVAISARGDYDWGKAKFDGRTMGTTYHVAIEYNSYDFEELQYPPLVEDRLKEINSRMSTYDPRSDLSQFNASKSTDWFEVSSETAKVTSAALDIAERTGGAFDPTVGPVVNLWGFGPEKRRREPPTEEEIEDALKSVGYKLVDVRLDPPALRKSNPGVYLDLSGIAKGYAADSVAELLVDWDQRRAYADATMVEIGGEVRTQGKKWGRGQTSAQVPWRLGIERPDPSARMIKQIVEIDNGDGLATSGDYRNFFEHEGQRFSHTIDPTTGRPVQHRLTTVTVRAETCMEADALATALLVMGPEKGIEWATKNEVAAILVERTDDEFREQVTPAWEARGGSNSVPSPETSENKPQEGAMLTYFLLTAAVFALAVAGMAVGVLLSNRRIKGTCGGIAGLEGESGKTACELCSNPSPTCTGNPNETKPEDELAEA